MSIKEYIIQKLEELVFCFPNMKFKYIQDSYTKSHIIEVFPAEEYETNDEYSNFEADIIFDFITKYPEDEIIFVKEDSIFDFNRPIYEISGKKCENIFSIEETTSIAVVSPNIKMTISENEIHCTILDGTYIDEFNKDQYIPEQCESIQNEYLSEEYLPSILNFNQKNAFIVAAHA